MNVKFRRIEVSAETAALLEERAAARGLTVADLVADLAGLDTLPPELDEERTAKRGPWSDAAFAEDARRLEDFRKHREGVPWREVDAWMKSWGTGSEAPPPKPRKL